MTTPGVSAKNASGPSAPVAGRLTLLPAVVLAGCSVNDMVVGAPAVMMNWFDVAVGAPDLAVRV